MDPKLGGGLAGCGCGAIAGVVTFVASSTALTFVAYGAYEAHLTRMGADTAVPLAVLASSLTSPCCALAVGGSVAVLVYRMLRPKG